MKWLLPVCAFALAGVAAAQTVDSARFYKLEFVFKEIESGKAVSSRSFSTMLPLQTPGRDTAAASVRANGKIPVSSGNNTNFIDLNVNINARDLREAQGDVSVSLDIDVSNLAQDASAAGAPGYRNNRWQGVVIVPARKPTMVFSSDDVYSKRQYQLELTATPIK